MGTGGGRLRRPFHRAHSCRAHKRTSSSLLRRMRRKRRSIPDINSFAGAVGWARRETGDDRAGGDHGKGGASIIPTRRDNAGRREERADSWRRVRPRCRRKRHDAQGPSRRTLRRADSRQRHRPRGDTRAHTKSSRDFPPDRSTKRRAGGRYTHRIGRTLARSRK